MRRDDDERMRDDDLAKDQADALRALLERLRLERRLTINRMEALAGAHGNPYGKFKRGERQTLTPRQLRRFAKVLEVSEDLLLTRAGHKTRPAERPSVVEAIWADATMAPKLKAWLLGCYEMAIRASQPGV